MKHLGAWERGLVNFVLVILLVAVNIASAQVSSGSISGVVRDVTGAVMPDAAITARQIETGMTRTGETGVSGGYNLPSLPVGPYELTVEKPGFKQQSRMGINLSVAQRVVVNFTLEVGNVTQVIEVTGEAPLVNTTTASVSGLIGEREIKELPINGRSFDLLVTLNPNTVNYQQSARRSGTGYGNMLSVAGRRPSSTLTMLNGIEYAGASNVVFTPGGASGQLLGMDAFREYNVVSDTYGAEYGKRGGGQVTVVTLSGTNQIHGTLFEFLRNDKLDARNFFDQADAPPFKRNNFGGALGGPIRRDRMFLFGNYEGLRQRRSQSSRIIVPDLDARRGVLNGVTVPDLDPRMLPYVNTFWPLPNGQNLGGGIAESYVNPGDQIRQDFGTVRFDNTFSSNDTLAAFYTIDDSNRVSAGDNPFFGSTPRMRNQIVSVQETHIFSPQVINTFSAGFTRAINLGISAPLVDIPADRYFVPGKSSPGLLALGAEGSLSFGTTPAGSHTSYRNYTRNLFTYSDGLQIIRGRHQISAGAWFQRVQVNDNDGLRGSGQATFSNLAALLAGRLTSLQVTPNTVPMYWRTWLGAWYLQDSVQLRPNLNVRVGLRHEFGTVWHEDRGNAQTYLWDSNGVIQTEPLRSGTFNTENNSKWLFGPRVGLAWDPFSNGKTSVRAAFGIYYDMVDSLTYLADTTPPLSGAASYTGSLFSVIPVNTSFVPPPCTGGPNVPSPCNIYAPKSTQPNYKVPTMNSWNFSIEQQLTSDMALRVGYTGMFTHHQWLTFDPNAIESQICNDPAGCVSGGILAAAARGRVPQGAEYIPVGTRPNRNLTSGIFLFSRGNQTYNALSVDLVKRITRGLQFRANYTWAKNLDYSSGLIGSIHSNEAQTVLDAYNPSRDYGPAGMDVPHIFNLNFGYQLPFGRNLTGVAGKLASGWQLNGIITALAGFPLTPFVSPNRSGNGDTNGADRVSLNPNFTGEVVTHDIDGWFHRDAFILPTAGTFGNVGRGRYRSPGLTTADLSLFKVTPIREGMNLQFRFEVFNIANHTNFHTPNLTIFSGGSRSGSAGRVPSTTTSSRQIQFGLKLNF